MHGYSHARRRDLGVGVGMAHLISTRPTWLEARPGLYRQMPVCVCAPQGSLYVVCACKAN
jgi:hypothetical protein